MNPTTRTKQDTRITFSVRKMRQFFRSIHWKSVKSSRHRSTVPDATLPSSASAATVPPVRDLEDRTDVMQDIQTIHDVVLKSKTSSETLDLDTTDGTDPSGLSSSSPHHGRPVDGESIPDSTSPSSPKNRCDECRSESGENADCTCVPTITVVPPAPPSPPRLSPAPSTFPEDDVVSLGTSDAGQASDQEGIKVEIVQVEQETDPQQTGDMNEVTYFYDSWGQANESWSWGDSVGNDCLLQDFSSSPPASTPPTQAVAEEVSPPLFSRDGRMILSLRNFLGAGTYGKVVSAEWADGCRSVAVKISNKLYISELDCTDQGLKYLKNELDVLKALKQSRERYEPGSNFFPELLKSWQDVKNVYFVMEMYACSLHDLRSTDLNWDPPAGDKLLWTAEMILGVQALHRMRILHRDIKPGNIFITTTRHIVIGDYGLARAWLDPVYANFPSTSLRARDSPGTLTYLAPEVVRGFYQDPINYEVRKYANYSFEADIWSLGVTICESWTPGTSLFGLEEDGSELESKIAIPKKILEMETEPAVKRIVKGHPIWYVINRMLDRDQRTRTGFSEILDDPVFALLDWNFVSELEYTPTWSFPEAIPYKSPKRVGDEIEFASYYEAPRDTHASWTDSQRANAERQFLRKAMGDARDWVGTQQEYVEHTTLFGQDFDWTAQDVVKIEDRWEEED